MSDPFDLFAPNRKTFKRFQVERDTRGSKKLPPPPWGVGECLGDFRFTKFIAQGGSGYVYAARNLKTEKKYAVKIIPTKYAQLALRNRLGFRLMMLVDHPNLLKVDRIHVIEDFNVLAMEEVEGETLFEWAKRTREAMNPRESSSKELEKIFAKIITLMRDYASGLAEIHGKGLLHRDVKPQNLMVTRDGRGVIIDYGCVSRYSFRTRPSERGQPVGTRGFVAPEVHAKRMHCPASDVYSLGMVLNACLHHFAKKSQPESPEPDQETTETITQSNEDASSFIQELTPRSPGMGVAKQGQDTDSDRKEISSNEAEETASHEEEELETQEEVNMRHETTLENLAGLQSIVPESLLEACVTMLDSDPAERPTASRLSRLGLPADQVVRLTVEDPLFGRDDPLQAMKRWADEVSRGKTSRLNLSGDSCFGKTRLLTELVRELEARGWAQVFVGRCRAREDAPFQAFTQICDAIADRYLSLDRERIKLDASSTQILCMLFPALRSVIHWDRKRFIRPRREPTREDALSAAKALCEQLVDIGPVFIMIDDAQWADQDSLHTLDYLRSATDGWPIGVVTASRRESDLQRVPADREIRLGPLSIGSSMEMLMDAASTSRITIDPATLRQLACSANGNPFRLRELASEMRPGGMLHDLDGKPIGDGDQLSERFWKLRFERLSDEAKQILLLVATGGNVAMQQLKQLTGLGDEAEAAVTELTRARLIQDDATGGECISAYHDQIAEGLIESFGDLKTKEAHARWAKLLGEENNPQLAARIAGHLLKADRPHQAVRFAVLAAENADHLIAPTEAGRWYEVAAKYSAEQEKFSYLVKAAECYEVSEQPRFAAHCYNEIVQLLKVGEDRNEYLQRAVILSIRGGDFHKVRAGLGELASQLHLPRPKSVWRSRLSSLVQIVRLQWSRRKRGDNLSHLAGVKKALGLSDAPRIDPEGSAAERSFNQMRLEVCHQLARPITMFDNPYSLELNLQAAQLAYRYGDDTQRIHAAVGEAVYRSYEGGRGRADAQETLLVLQQYVSEMDNLQIQSDVWAGLACVHTMAMRWKHVEEPLRRAVRGYASDAGNCQFELAHSNWMELWSTWHQGRWGQLVCSGRQMVDDATQRGDLFLLRMTCGAFGIGVWLAEDKLDEYDRLWHRISGAKQDVLAGGSVELFGVFEWISFLMRGIYQGDYEVTWTHLTQVRRKMKRSHFNSMQVIRVILASFRGLLGLHLYAETRSAKWVRQVRAALRDLRSEKEPYPRILANFYEGLLLAMNKPDRMPGDQLELCVIRFSQAAQEAEDEMLRPVQLAALDALDSLKQKVDSEVWKTLVAGGFAGLNDQNDEDFKDGRLVARMRRRNVAQPEKLARLYTVDFGAIG